MATPVPLKNLTVSLCLLSLLATNAFGQTNSRDTVHFASTVTAFSQDRTGNIFMAFTGGAITKYTSDFDSLISFSPVKLGDITLLEASHGFQIFAFYEDFQEYAIFDRFLTRGERYRLSQTMANYVDNCTFSRDQNLWAFEENQLRLVKVNLSIRQIDVEVPLEFIINNQDHRITYLKEYQNLVFLVDKNSGIYLFDNLGNYLRKVEAPGIKHCGFTKEQLYFIADNNLHILSLYEDNHQLLPLSPADYLGVIPADGFVWLITPGQAVKFVLPIK